MVLPLDFTFISYDQKKKKPNYRAHTHFINTCNASPYRAILVIIATQVFVL